jgi:transcriptional regulator with XRE-family HTH domain
MRGIYMSSIFCEVFLNELKMKGWTQKEIAELLGITQPHASRLARGGTPSIEIVIKLADHFRVSTDKVLGRDHE